MPKLHRHGLIYFKEKKEPLPYTSKDMKRFKGPRQAQFPKSSLIEKIKRNYFALSPTQMAKKFHKQTREIYDTIKLMKLANLIPSRKQVAIDYITLLKKKKIKKTIEKISKTTGIKTLSILQKEAKKIGYVFNPSPKKPRIGFNGRKKYYSKQEIWKKILQKERGIQTKLARELGIGEGLVSRDLKKIRKEKKTN